MDCSDGDLLDEEADKTKLDKGIMMRVDITFVGTLETCTKLGQKNFVYQRIMNISILGDHKENFPA